MKKRWICGILLAAICLLALCGCGQQKEIYENHALGIRLEFPQDWKGSYSVEQNPANAAGLIIKTEWSGDLGYLFCYTPAQWEENGKGAQIPTEYKVLSETEDWVVVLQRPGDIQYDPADTRQAEVYQKMSAQLDAVSITKIQ